MHGCKLSSSLVRFTGVRVSCAKVPNAPWQKTLSIQSCLTICVRACNYTWKNTWNLAVTHNYNKPYKVINQFLLILFSIPTKTTAKVEGFLKSSLEGLVMFSYSIERRYWPKFKSTVCVKNFRVPSTIHKLISSWKGLLIVVVWLIKKGLDLPTMLPRNIAQDYTY